MWMESLGKVRH